MAREMALLVLLGASLHETAGFQAASFARGQRANHRHGAPGVHPSPPTVVRVQPFGGPGEGEEIPQEVCDAEERAAPGRQIRVGIAGGVAVISAALAVLQEVLPGGTPAILDSPAAAAAEGVLAVGACLLIQQEYGERGAYPADAGHAHPRPDARHHQRTTTPPPSPPVATRDANRERIFLELKRRKSDGEFAKVKGSPKGASRYARRQV